VIDRWAAQVDHVLEVTYSNGEEMVVREVKMTADDNFSFAKKYRKTERQKYRKTERQKYRKTFP
jgi:hypothetical protein